MFLGKGTSCDIFLIIDPVVRTDAVKHFEKLVFILFGGYLVSGKEQTLKE